MFSKKVSFLIICLIVFFLFNLTAAHAHIGTPFVSINGVVNKPDPILAGSSFFKIANEISPQDYTVHQKLNFTINNQLLPVDPSIVGQSSFTWDFGDGTTSSNLETTHTYSKSGSYIAILKVKDPGTDSDYELESVKLNILPTANTALPKAVITVDGKTINDPLKEIIKIAKDQTLSLDASFSKGKIKKVTWDFGDGSQISNETKISHKFTFSPLTYTLTLFPILKVEDENNLTSETYVQFSTTDGTKTTTSKSNNSKTSTTQVKAAGALNTLAAVFYLGLGIVVILAIRAALKFQNKRK